MISERLKQLRKERRMSQSMVARGINITDRSYQAYEYDEKRPSYEKLIALAELFNCSTDYLLGRTDNPEVNK